MGLHTVLKWLLVRKCLRVYDRFRTLARDPRAVQETVLLEKLRCCQDSRFGRDHAFADIHSVETFRRRLPVATYEDFVPYIEDLKRGDVRACFGPGERVLMFALTSGTHAEPKYIPVTKTFLREYRLGWHVWGGAVARTRMSAYDHYIFRVVSPCDERHTEAGIPCGSISGFMTESLPRIVRNHYVPPLEVARIKHAPSRYYLAGRIGLTHRISLLSSANPSSILSVVRAVDANRETIVRDLHDGTVDASWEVPDEIKRRLARHLRPRTKRAAEIEKIIHRTGRLLPKDYWPELGLISNWKGGSCGLYLDCYDEYFGDVPVHDIGLLASEGRMTIPLTSDGSSGPLDITSHFFEFIPEAEIERENPTTLLTHELAEGEKYFILLTTSSGLYRYNIMDLVEVTGFCERTPEVRFLNKGRHFSSLTGEKISEFHVVESLARAYARLNLDAADGVLSPMSGETPRYSLAVEKRAELTLERARAFLESFEEALRACNVEYRAKRESNRLAAPVLHVLHSGAFARTKQDHLERTGGRTEQYKHRFITGEIDTYRTLPVEETIEPTASAVPSAPEKPCDTND